MKQRPKKFKGHFPRWYKVTHIKLDHGFLQVMHIPRRVDFLKPHNTLHDVAIYIGKMEEGCLFIAGWQLEKFPEEIERNEWKRISFYRNNIKCLPLEGLKCRKLVSLILGAKIQLEEVPISLIHYLPSIRVLDLSKTKIKLLPETLLKLIQLKYLDISYTQIECLSKD